MKRPSEDSTQSEGEKTERKKKVKSGPSREMSYVTFVNHTARTVDVIWINFDGQGVRYKTLQPRAQFDVTTFVGHPWVFRDCNTGDKLVVQFKTVYNPESMITADGRRLHKRVVYITLPVYSLRERSMQVVRDVFSRSLIPQLEIPSSLISELLHPHNDLVLLN